MQKNISKIANTFSQFFILLKATLIFIYKLINRQVENVLHPNQFGA